MRAQTLTSDLVNGEAARILALPAGNPELEALLQDWREVVKERAQLTPAQEQALDGIPAAHVNAIQGALKAASIDHSALSLSLPQETGGEGELRIVGKIACTFGADCGDWSCHPDPPDVGI